MGRTIVIGDIHGCFDELTDLLNLVELAQDDRVVAVGDLIVKGEKNREVLDLFIDDKRFSSVTSALRLRFSCGRSKFGRGRFNYHDLAIFSRREIHLWSS